MNCRYKSFGYLLKGKGILVQGTIIKGIGGFYYVKAEDLNIYECKARGIFRKDKIKPMIGDRVVIDIDASCKGSITDILERSSSLIRPPVANIDTLVIVLASKNPDPDFLLCDKLILAARIKILSLLFAYQRLI